jgi:hypothetical protein
MIGTFHHYSRAFVSFHYVEVDVASKSGVNEFDKG